MTATVARPSQTWRSLRIRNFRLWFTGQVISVAGTWTQTVAQAVLVLRLSNNNGIAAGASVATQYLPTLLFGVWGGLLADRLDKRRLLMVTQSVLALLAGLLAVLDLSGVIRLWMVYVVVALSGCATALDQPTRQSFVTELVGEEDLPNAIGLNSTIFNGARMVGPAVAAGVIFVSGTGGCFLINSLSYVAILVALLRMRTEELHSSKRLSKARGQVREGIAYAWAKPILRSNLLLMTMVGTFAFNFTVVIPLISKVTFHGGAGTVSEVFIFQGAGALAGALLIASIRRTDGRRLVVATMVLGIAMFAASLAPTMLSLLIVMPFMGMAQIFTASSSNALIQLDTEPSMRGRVTSLRTLTVIGSTPIGGLMAGAISQWANPRWAMAMGGAGCLAGLALGRTLFADSRSDTAVAPALASTGL
jgi:MFS family permease